MVCVIPVSREYISISKAAQKENRSNSDIAVDYCLDTK